MTLLFLFLLSVTPALPEPLTGSWGFSVGDCAEGPSAEGFLHIAPDGIDFYESRARLMSVDEATETSVVATYEFSGEGETWQKQMSLTLSDEGKTLTRLDLDSDETSPIEYTFCY